MARDLWKTGINLGENTSLTKRIRHSSALDMFRRKSASRIGRKAVSFGISFIPIPVVKKLVDAAVKKGLDKARAWQTKHKLGRETMDAQSKEKKVKWGWKDMDVGSLDRYRWKVQHGVEVMNQALKKAVENEKDSVSVCNDWARPIAKYAYLRHRLTVLREKVSVIKVLCEDTEAWLNQVEDNVNASGIENKLRMKAAEINATRRDWDHAHCDEKLCVHGSAKRFVEEHKKIAKGLQVTTSFLTEIAEPPASKAVGTESYYGAPKN